MPATTTAFDIRPCQADELSAYFKAAAHTFGEGLPDAAIDWWRMVIDPSRTLVAFDDGDVVATSCTIDMPVSVPGETLVPASGISWVTTRATHRRSGLMTGMMQRLLADCDERDEVAQMLWASEATIYRRFGFGPVTRWQAITIDAEKVAADARLTSLAAESSIERIRYVDPETAVDAVRDLHDRWCLQRPAAIPRTEAFWKRWTVAGEWAFEPTDSGVDDQRSVAVAYDADGTAVAYADFRIKGKWDDYDRPDGTVDVQEAVYHSPQDQAWLVQWLASIDLMRRVKMMIPPDDAIYHLPDNPRALTSIGPDDGLWMRIGDVAGALMARSYDADGSLVIEVVDDHDGASIGRYNLVAANGSGAVAEVPRTPDFSIARSDLAALVFGGRSASELAAAARLTLGDGTADTLVAADAIFATRREPWCLLDF